MCRKIRGEHSDARELAALYVSSGVPVYPLCRGFSYQTLTWRMLAEAQGMRTSDENGSPGPGTSRRTFGRGTFGNVSPASFAADAASRAESSNSTTN